MQTDLEADYPDLEIQILGINHLEWGGGNSYFAAGNDIPWLQDEDTDGNTLSDVWEAWGVTGRDVVILDGGNLPVATYNLTEHDLDDPGNYDTLLQMLVDTASAEPPWQNPGNPMDVNGDTQITPVGDVLLLINELNLHQVCDEVGRLPVPPEDGKGPPPYYDVDGDNFLSPARDVLPLINYFNQPSAEGEGVVRAPPEDFRYAVMPASSNESAQVASPPAAKEMWPVGDASSSVPRRGATACVSGEDLEAIVRSNDDSADEPLAQDTLLDVLAADVAEVCAAFL